MTLLAFLFLLTLVPAGCVRSRHPPKAAISSPVFGPREVHGVKGGSVTVKCFYPPTPMNKHDRKYWCRQKGSGCLTVVSSSFVAAAYQGRVTLTDHPQENHFLVNISALEMSDAGTFQCGVGINGRGLSFRVTLSVAEAPPVPEDAELFYVKLRSTWTVTCGFGKETVEMKKYLCKKEKDGCRNIINSYQDKDVPGGLQLVFENPPGSFRVTMTQMDWEDAGLYYCGAGDYEKDDPKKELDVFIYEDKNFPQFKTNITGKVGGSASFECLYDPLLNASSRFWCKQRGRQCGTTIIDNTGRVEDSYEGRVTVFQNPENKTLTIILNQLQEKDKGTYWCMSNQLREQQSSTELTVIPGEPLLTGKKVVEAQAGSRVNLTCCYPCKYYSYEKYWCRWSNTGCAMLPVQQQQGLPQPGDACEPNARTVVLSLDPVAEEDEGWYWCGVKHNGVFGETMAVELRVSAGKDAKLSPEFLDVDSSHDSAAVPPGGAHSDAEVRKGAAPESSDESQGSNTLALVLGPLAGLILIAVTAFAIVKYRQLKRSDLVSVGSYRTNISMSDFESVRDFSASNSAKETHETSMGGDEFITTTMDTPDSAANTTKAKRSSKEEADLAYSSFLATSSNIAQASSGGDSTVLDVSPPQDQA
ncbi:polymeric immunoglobulin receptor [Ammospiza caudacuta]|uniref:polymeric immunoglobulin receptor n=1 Tax=Ammospiza caudacuta TaxID=2857398 RepID=UPI0027395575|nr:polymeric immunoglobulin receptor [Ammospiza caudacuta]